MAKRKKGCLTEKCKGLSILRIRRIEGQIQGIKKMIEEDRYCLELLQQLSSVQEALRGLGKEIMKNYLEECVSRAILSKRRDRQEAIYRELMDVIYKYVK